MARLTKEPWFRSSRTGGVFPFPVSWQGWTGFLGFLLLLAATVRLEGESGWIARGLLLVAFGGLIYLTYEAEA